MERPPLPLRPRASLVPVAARRRRRLSDKIRVGFHEACDKGAMEIAEALLNHLDGIIHCPPVLPTGVDRRQMESLTALCERLANLFLWRTESGLNPIL